MEPHSKLPRVQCLELSFWEGAGLHTRVAGCAASLGAVGVAVAMQKSMYSVFAAGDTCKLVVFVHIFNDATWLFARRKNIIQH